MCGEDFCLSFSALINLLSRRSREDHLAIATEFQFQHCSQRASISLSAEDSGRYNMEAHYSNTPSLRVVSSSFA